MKRYIYTAPIPVHKNKAIHMQNLGYIVQGRLHTIQHLDMNTTTPLKVLETVVHLWSELQ